MTSHKTVIALGFFDGLHIGHAELLKRVFEVGWQNGATPTMMTFDTHPDELVGRTAVPLLTSPDERAAIAGEYFGIENIIALHFDEDIRRMPWQDFLEWLHEDFGAIGFVVGHDFRFGANAEGSADKLCQWVDQIRGTRDPRVSGYIVPAVTVDGEIVSSTLIRKFLTEGDIERANRLLGRRHRVTDIVRSGYRLGRTIGAPTINMRFPKGVIVPKRGVYATRLRIEDDPALYRAVTNIGVRPTVSEREEVTIESYVLDFDRQVYGKRVRVEFERFIRPEQSFKNLDELKLQIERDIQTVRAM
jgi:riboflavin kinase/FMN adenylyltransferase